MRKRARERLIREAKEWLDLFGIDWSRYGPAELEEDADPGDSVLEIRWLLLSTAHEISPSYLKITSIWADENGHIQQAGDNGGDLTL